MKKLCVAILALIIVLSVGSVLTSQPIPTWFLRFIDLHDTPTTYTGQAGKYAKVNAGETALEFGTPAGSGDMTKAVYDVAGNNIVDGDDTAYDATSWNANPDAPSKNAVRDKIEALGGGHAAVTLTALADKFLSLSTQEIDLQLADPGADRIMGWDEAPTDGFVWLDYSAWDTTASDDLTSSDFTTDGGVLVGTGVGTYQEESGATLRTSIGVGTGNSPQFTAIELGHATDTTIARSGAGAVTVEGAAVYLAGAEDTIAAAISEGAYADSTVVSADIKDATVAFADIDNTITLVGNPALAASEAWFGTTGIIFEGSTADLIEGLLTAADPTSADKTWTLPDVTGNVVIDEQINTPGELETVANLGAFFSDYADDADAATMKTTLGLGTGNSPQFTAIELGHATDTTIARSGAGDITIEGNAVYRAGGTDVADADVADNITLTNITQITTRSHTSLSDIGTNTHAQIDTHVGDTTDAHTVSSDSLTLTNKTIDADGAGNSITNIDEDNCKDTSDLVRSGINIVIDGGGSEITTGIKFDVEIPFNCVIQRVTMLGDQSGSIAVDLWVDTYANYPPTDADSITAAAVPTITTATKSQDTTLTGWTTSLTAGSILRGNVDSVTTITRCTISLVVER